MEQAEEWAQGRIAIGLAPIGAKAEARRSIGVMYLAKHHIGEGPTGCPFQGKQNPPTGTNKAKKAVEGHIVTKDLARVQAPQLAYEQIVKFRSGTALR